MLNRLSDQMVQHVADRVEPSLGAVRGAALMRIWHILAKEAGKPPMTRGRSIEVVDAAGRTVLIVPFEDAVGPRWAMH